MSIVRSLSTARVPVKLASALLASIVIAACGGDAAPRADLPPAAQEGLTLLRSKGCGACHGSSGDGLVGPPLTGLFGSEVAIQGSPPIIADREYVRESIVAPNAKLVEGYSLQMPEVDLTDAEVDAIVAYIEAIGPTAEEAQS